MTRAKTCLVMFAGAFFSAASYAQCNFPGDLLIDTRPGHPFIADVAITISGPDEDGRPAQVSHFFERVARDRFGRVWHSTFGGGSPHLEGIDDPVAHRSILLQTAYSTSMVWNRSSDKNEFVATPLHRGATIWDMHDFSACSPWPPSLPTLDFVRREPEGLRDIGWLAVSGLQLHGYRVAISGVSQETATITERMEQNYMERYRTQPDDLGADRLVLLRSPNSDQRFELINLKLVEPDPALFQIPSEFKIETQVEFFDDVDRKQQELDQRTARH